MAEQLWGGNDGQAAGGEMPLCTPQMMMDDDYMLYVYKVRPCDRKGAHSWTECPFTHPGEKAARRCPKTHIYSAEACPDARKSGKCVRGDACPYSHGVFEQWLHPSRYRTQLCSFGGACRRPVCFFAHTVQELRMPTPCGPAPAAAAAAQQAATAAAAAAAACQHPMMPGSMDVMLQQALLAQMQAPAQVDGATATLINRYQAASCAALANAAACQRQQQQHQAAAAAAAAAAIAAAASNPASLLGMAQAAQAYQAAAAAAAAAAAGAAHAPYSSGGLQQPHHMQQLAMPGAPTPFACGAAAGSNSGGSSPTCNSGASTQLSSFLTDGSGSGLVGAGSATPADSVRSGPHDLGGAAAAAAAATSNNYLLQQALLAAAGGGRSPVGGMGGFGGPSAGNACASPLLPWGMHGAGLGAPGGCYPSGLMPVTPAASDSSMASAGTTSGGSHGNSLSCGLDALAPHLQRQLSLSMFQQN